MENREMAVQTHRQTQARLPSLCSVPSPGSVPSLSNALPFPNAPPSLHSPDALGRRNCALRAVPEVDWQRFAARIERCVLVEGQTLHAPSQAVERVYFPNSGVVSLLVEDKQGHSIEAMMTGKEGALGALLALSGQPSTLRAQVRVPGTALWMEADAFRQEFARGGEFAAWFLRYFHYTNVCMGQYAFCNRLHGIEERLARWLLTLSDRLTTSEFSITHEMIAQTLGARRSGVTVALGDLQRAGFLDISRGSLCLCYRDGLEAAACSCYQTMRSAFDAL